MIYAVMFIIALLSGSLLPLGSEALFLYYISSGNSIIFLLLVATFGNVLGSLINYWLGLKGEKYLLKRGYIKLKTLNRAKNQFQKYGYFALLLSSLPIIGDPLTFIAGIVRYKLNIFITLVTISKFLRYLTIVIIYHYS